MKKILPLLFMGFCLSSCDTLTQTTSGASYLEKYKNVPAETGAKSGKISIDDHIRKVAAVEPTLKFPARIGIAYIEGGHLKTIPGVEIEAWEKARNKLGSGFGEFVPLNPMLANMVAESVSSENNAYNNDDVMNRIRLGAARQHLDAVLIYEAYSNTDSECNLLSIADLTIIGAYLLPSRSVTVEGFATALLIDVVQGYPYGTSNVTVDKEEAYSSTLGWGSDSRKELSGSVKTKAVIKLVEEVEKMFNHLYTELQQKRAKK